METGGSATGYTYISEVEDRKYGLHGTTQGTVDIFNLEHDKELSLPSSIVEEYNFLSLLILDRTGTVHCVTTGDTRGAAGGNTDTATIFLCCNCHLLTLQRQPSVM